MKVSFNMQGLVTTFLTNNKLGRQVRCGAHSRGAVRTEMNDKSSKIAHFASLFVFITVWSWLIYLGAFLEANVWINAGFFVMGASFAVSLLTRRSFWRFGVVS